MMPTQHKRYRIKQLVIPPCWINVSIEAGEEIVWTEDRYVHFPTKFYWTKEAVESNPWLFEPIPDPQPEPELTDEKKWTDAEMLEFLNYHRTPDQIITKWYWGMGSIKAFSIFKQSQSTPASYDGKEMKGMNDDLKPTVKINFDGRGEPYIEPVSTPKKERIKVTELNTAAFSDHGNWYGFHIAANPDKPFPTIPSDKFDVVKQAIESVLNNDPLYTKQQLIEEGGWISPSEYLPNPFELVWIKRTRGVIYIGYRLPNELSTDPDPSRKCFWYGNNAVDLVCKASNLHFYNNFSDVTVEGWQYVTPPKTTTP